MVSASPNCRRLLWQVARRAFSFADVSAGSSSEARIEMIAITTSSSMSVNPLRSLHCKNDLGWVMECRVTYGSL